MRVYFGVGFPCWGLAIWIKAGDESDLAVYAGAALVAAGSLLLQGAYERILKAVEKR